MLLGVDDSLGRIVATLARKGILDDTVIVFTSDHGYFYGEHGLNEERRLAYEETIRIPLIVRFPRLVTAGITPVGDGPQHRPGADAARGGWRCRRAPTCRAGRSCRCSRRRHRAGARRSWSSTSATPCSRASGPWVTRPSAPSGTSTSSTASCTDMDELYDLEADPYEMTNIIGRPESRRRAAADEGGAATAAGRHEVSAAP